MSEANGLRRELKVLGDPASAAFLQKFFKTAQGEYGEGDRFLGVRVPQVRSLVRPARAVSLSAVLELLPSPWHEERLLALLCLVDRYRRGDSGEREVIYAAYLANTAHINNWDLVDTSAEHIVGAHLAGAHLLGEPRAPSKLAVLERLARSTSLWERRIAIMATFHFIRQKDFGPTLAIASMLVNDPHDLIHKAVGWMLREIGKRDRSTEERFLAEHYQHMPRTMLRYAIEKFPEDRRQAYLKGSV